MKSKLLKKKFRQIEGRGLWQVTIPTSIDDVEDYIIAKNEMEVKEFVALKYPDRNEEWDKNHPQYKTALKRLDFFSDIYITR